MELPGLSEDDSNRLRALQLEYNLIISKNLDNMEEIKEKESMKEEKFYKIKVEDYKTLIQEFMKACDSMHKDEYKYISFYLGKIYGAFLCMIERNEE